MIRKGTGEPPCKSEVRIAYWFTYAASARPSDKAAIARSLDVTGRRWAWGTRRARFWRWLGQFTWLTRALRRLAGSR